jgi:hypothetical protein
MAKEPQGGQSGTPQQHQAEQGTSASPASPPQGTTGTTAMVSVDTGSKLREAPRLTVAFPPCSGELLALIRTAEPDEITTAFKDYFKFRPHRIFGEMPTLPPSEPPTYTELDTMLGDVIDERLLNCRDDDVILRSAAPAWPSECCICSPCVTLNGDRVPIPGPSTRGIRRLFLGDVAWLFFYERMGIQQILGAILDAFATTGRIPISNGSLEPLSIKDDVVALVLEVMVRQTKMGLSSSVRDRGALYRTTLGWESPLSRGLRLDTEVNAGFSSLFHRFIYNALEYYRDRRLAVAIQAASVGRPSVATLVTLSDTADLLKKRFEAFAYGRNYYNALAGIVWTVAAMTVIRDLRQTLGIAAAAFNDPYEFIPAAYDLLVMKRPHSRSEVNRYDVHRRCAISARQILLDLEVVPHLDTSEGGPFERWVIQSERHIETYRTAYRNLTGIDLGAAANVAVEQQVQGAS